MTELETHLLTALKRLENHYQSRDQVLANTLNDLGARLEVGASQWRTLAAQMNALSERIERLNAILKDR